MTKRAFYFVCLSLFLCAGPVSAVVAQARTSITITDAERIALAQVPGGQVTKIERDVERGTAVFEVEVVDEHGLEHDILIDAADGRVIRAHIDQD